MAESWASRRIYRQKSWIQTSHMWASYDFVSFANQNVEKTTTCGFEHQTQTSFAFSEETCGGVQKREPHDPTHKTTL